MTTTNTRTTVNSVNRFELEKYKGPASRYACPQCGQKKKFTRYIDRSTGSYVHDTCGKCDREDKCGYHLSPKQYFAQTGEAPKPSTIDIKSIEAATPISYLPFDVMEQSITQHKRTALYAFLVRLFGHVIATELCRNYLVGSSKNGDTVFWQVDHTGKIRQAKAMVYDKYTGKRSKVVPPRFVGKTILNDNEARLEQCFFGEYLLTMDVNEGKAVAIVESEKTALICSVYLPEYVWIATGGKNGCKWTTAEVCKVLKGRRVVLFPDLNAYDVWKTKGELMARVAGARVIISDLLEKSATQHEKMNGLDLADYLLKTQDTTGLALTEAGYPVMFDFKTTDRIDQSLWEREAAQ